MRRPAAPTAGAGIALAAFGLLAGCGERPREGAGPEEIFRVYCARCHGADGRGEPRQRQKNPGLDLLTGDLVAAGDRRGIRDRIAAGHGPMPGFEDKLSPADVERLTDLVLRLAAAGAR